MDISNFKKQGMELMKRQSPKTMSKVISAIMIVLIIIFWVGKMKRTLLRNNNRRLESIYSDLPPITSVNTSLERFVLTAECECSIWCGACQ